MTKWLLALIPTVALATDFTPETCGTPGAWCSNEPSAGQLLTYSPQYGRLNWYDVDGTHYDSGLYAVPAWSYSFSAVPLYNVTSGAVKYVTASFTTYRTCSKYCLTHWMLQSGSVQ